METKKERFIAILLALLVGAYGLHWFYLKDNDKGTKYLVTSVVGLVTSVIFIGLIPLLIVSILALIDLFKFAFMSDAEFDALYNQVSA